MNPVGRPRDNLAIYRARHAAIIVDYLDGCMSLKECAKKYHKTWGRIRQILHRAEIPVRAKGRYPAWKVVKEGPRGRTNQIILDQIRAAAALSATERETP